MPIPYLPSRSYKLLLLMMQVLRQWRTPSIPVFLGKSAFLLGILLGGFNRAQAQSPYAYSWVAAGSNSSFAIGADGSLWSWGLNLRGELGNGTFDSSYFPRQLSTPPTAAAGTRWLRVWPAAEHTVALRSDSTLWAWGANGLLGNGSLPSSQIADGASSPTVIPAPAGAVPRTVWKTASAGAIHTLAIRSDGTLWAWGNNAYGQLGINSAAVTSAPVPLLVPHPATAPPGTFWTQVCASINASSFALRSDGTLWSWGRTELTFSILGHPAPVTGSPQPELVPAPATAASGTVWTAVSAGYFHALALRSDGTLWTWGRNASGAMGIGLRSSGSITPVQVPLPAGTPAGVTWRQIQAGAEYSQAILSNGTVYAWGNNEYGQLGINSGDIVIDTPQLEYNQVPWTQTGAGIRHVIGLSRGQVYVSGTSTNGQLGLGTAPNRFYFFVRVVGLPLPTLTVKATNISYTLYPNPAVGGDMLTLSGAAERAQIQLVNTVGQIVVSEPVRGGQIQLPPMPAGLYQVRITADDKVVSRQHLMVY